jgi:hypothetical protein
VIVKANAFKTVVRGGILLLAISVGGCGEYVRNSGRAPAQPIILALAAAPGATPDKFSGTLASDVITIVNRTVGQQQVQVPTIFNDFGSVTMRIILKDPGAGSVAAPTPLNQVTFTRYTVVYRRSDGRNTAGVDVPYPMDGGLTFTVQSDKDVTAAFELVRHTAKEEAPLKALVSNGMIISTVADITFYGRDQAGNDVSVAGSISVDFGNFGDPS